MSETLETVTIETEAGPVMINKSDYDKKVHTLHVEKPVADAPKKLSKADLQARCVELEIEFKTTDNMEVLGYAIRDKELVNLLASIPAMTDDELAENANSDLQSVVDAVAAEIADRKK